jgi:hypothetical protein
MDNNVRSYQSFSGGDIVATFGGQVIGELLNITWSVTREKAPNYTLGSVNPRGYARGRRGIAGSLVFGVFDRNALLDEMKNTKYSKFQTYQNPEKGYVESQFLTGDYDGDDVRNPEEFNDFLQPAVSNNGDLLEEGVGWNPNVEYADQLLPFNITVNMANETGAQAQTTLIDVEILNQGMGVSIQDLAVSQNYTFVCRDIQELESPADVSGADPRHR